MNIPQSVNHYNTQKHAVVAHSNANRVSHAHERWSHTHTWSIRWLRIDWPKPFSRVRKDQTSPMPPVGKKWCNHPTSAQVSSLLFFLLNATGFCVSNKMLAIEPKLHSAGLWDYTTFKCGANMLCPTRKAQVFHRFILSRKQHSMPYPNSQKLGWYS